MTDSRLLADDGLLYREINTEVDKRPRCLRRVGKYMFDENIEHFIIECEALSHIRVPILKEIRDICDSLYPVSDKNILLQIILDSQKILNYDNKSENMIMLEYQCRRLCFSLHCERYKKLGLIPNRQRRKL